MAKCIVKSHEKLWRIKGQAGEKRTIFCLAREYLFPIINLSNICFISR